MIGTRTRLFNLLRRPLCSAHCETALLKVTMGRPPRHLLCRVVPNHYQYPRGTVRNVARYGRNMKLDISDMGQWYLYWGFHDPSHEALVSLCKPGDVVLDIGANIGLTALRMSDAVGNGMIYAFEPDPQNYGDCLNHILANDARNVKCFQLALGSEEGVAGLRYPESRNRGCIWVDTANPVGSHTAHVSTVDCFCAREGLSRVDLIKVDTEGTELTVLKGAAKVIERCKPRLFLEVSEGHLRRAKTSPGALWGFLADMGYSVHHAESGRILRSGSDLAHGHFDIICQASPE